MGNSLSTNIKNGNESDFKYVSTPNAQKVFGNIVDSFHSGIHSFTIIGSYGTGKSSFLMALEKDIEEGTSYLVQNRSVFSNALNFEFIKVVGEYTSLSSLLSKELELLQSDESKNIFDALRKRIDALKKKKGFLFMFVDEFGKILEHAANNNPEKELYFLQMLAEFVNVPTRNVILLATLHQNFGSYSHKLTETQRNEWTKVKGRFKEMVFAEPVEQLLYIATVNLSQQRKRPASTTRNHAKIHNLAVQSKFISESFPIETTQKLYPLDPISASCLTLAMQRYGQNERTLFAFLNDTGSDSVRVFKANNSLTYNLAAVYDYIAYNLYSSVSEANLDSTNWRAISVAIERVESGIIEESQIEYSLMIVKAVGLLNVFYKGVATDRDFLVTYANLAMGIPNPGEIVEKLTACKIIRFATYKSQYVLFEGTDINIEDELYKAARIVPSPLLTPTEIEPYIKESIVMASASYYKTGTPRYFKYIVTNEPIDVEPVGDIDGYINLILPLEDEKDRVIETSKGSQKAILYAIYNDTDTIGRCLYEIKKLQYLLDSVVFEDRVAKEETEKQQLFEVQRLNEIFNHVIEPKGGNITWVFNGEELPITCRREFNKILSSICDMVYNKTPIIRNELFNRHKVSSAISTARQNLLDAMIKRWQEPDFGFDSTLFPPEKTIYYTLFKETGIHHSNEDGLWSLGEPTSPGIKTLWDVSVDILKQSAEKPIRLSEFAKILTSRPYKLKQGVVDLWIPIFLFIKQQEYALYNGDNFVFEVNKEVIELLYKHLRDFSLKALNVSSVKLEIFNKYREFLNKEHGESITSNSLMNTIRPFFRFYNELNAYAKSTKKFDNPATATFRDILASAKDPCKTFLEDIPIALGYSDLLNDEFIPQYLTHLKSAVHELATCYDLFIDRVERAVVNHLGLSQDFLTYKKTLSERYININKDILTSKTRSFLDRVLSPAESKREFFEKIGYVVIDTKIENIKDSEEAQFLSRILHLFSELERYRAFGEMDYNTEEVAFNFEIGTSRGEFKQNQTYRLPKSKLREAEKIEESVLSALSGETELDICILLDLLNKKIN